MKTILAVLSNLVLVVMLNIPAVALEIPSEVTLIKNVNIFDGKNDELLMGYDVLVVKNIIKKIDKDIKIANTYEIDVKTGGLKEVASGGHSCSFPSVVTVYEPEKMVKKEVKVNIIDGNGRTLTPGFIDMHYHLSLASVKVRDMAGSNAPDLDYIGIQAGMEAERVLMRGFTSLRDVGGASWGAKLAADRDEIAGPRIWPSLRAISQFGGHGDANPRYMKPREFGGPENNLERLGYSRIVNGRDDVLVAARENLKNGASQIKMHLAGGVGTEFDPIDGRQFTMDEIKAAVEVAEGFGTYVAAHVYTVDGTKQAIEAGVKSIEHGNLINEEIAKMMAKKGVWLSPQVVVYLTFSPDLGPVRLAKGAMVREGLDNMFRLAKKYNLKMVFGTDVVVNPEAASGQNREFVERAKWFTPAEILNQATAKGGELLQLSGDRNPYPGKIGVIEEGALADILLINGNPLEDISILSKPDENLALIMKDGKIYMNALP